MTAHESVLGDALTYEDYLPVTLRPTSGPPDMIRLNGINSQSEDILHNILLLEKQHSDLADEDTDRLSSELAYIDFKLNVLLDLMVQAFANQLNIPPESHIFLSSTCLRLECADNDAYHKGDHLFLDLYLSRRFPRPLTLFATVMSVEALENGEGASSILEFEHMSQTVRDLLERFIFLKHRRMIASTKRERD
jgi:hypothetical protein